MSVMFLAQISTKFFNELKLMQNSGCDGNQTANLKISLSETKGLFFLYRVF